MITIYGSDGIAKAQVPCDDNSTQEMELQGDNVLNLSFVLYEHVALDVNDYAEFMGRRYWLMERYHPEQTSTVEWKYAIKLYGIESLVKRFLVINDTDGDDEPVFTLTAPPRDHVALIVKSINNGMGTTDWKVGTVEGTDNIVIDYFGKYCDEALKEVAEKVGHRAEWWVEGQTVNICRCEQGEEVTLAYGKGLLSLSGDMADNAKFYTRLYPVGSTRNIDPEKYGHSRLQLPGGAKHVDVNVDKYGVWHHYEADAFADIYPRRVGTVSSVRKEETKDEEGNPFTIWYFKDDSLDFDPNDYELPQLVKRVSFQEGSELAGLGDEEDGTYYFEVNYDSDNKEFEIITIWPYDDDTQLPNDNNVFSARRTLKEALSRLRPDTAQEKITFAKGLDIGVYSSLVSGGTFRTDEQGNTYIEADNIFIRKKATIQETQVNRVTHIAGEYIVSSASFGNLFRVEEFETHYRCYADDGEIDSENDFIVGDMAICRAVDRMETLKPRYYWRKVVGVGDNYVDLSKTDADAGSDIPVAGDALIQLGYDPVVGGSEEPGRQNAVIISSVAIDSPGIKLLQGIGSYTLQGKEVISQGFDKSTARAFLKVLGDFAVGVPEQNTYLVYDSVNKVLRIKGKFITEHYDDLDKALEEREYLKEAFRNDTTIDGGVIATSLVQLGYRTPEGEYAVMSGVSGLDRGAGSISYWAGGEPVDRFTYDEESGKYVEKEGLAGNEATALIRMDGTGYLAAGNIRWDKKGKIDTNLGAFYFGDKLIDAYLNIFQLNEDSESGKLLDVTPLVPMTDIDVNHSVTIGGATLVWDAANKAVKVYDSKNGEPISLYTTGSLSALGLGSLEGGGGGGEGLIKLVHGFDDLGGVFDNTTMTETFNAYTINEIWELANAGASTIGTGNVVTAVSKTGGNIVVTKGITLYDWVRQPNKPTYSLSEINNVSGTYTGLAVGRSVESDNAKKLNGLDNGAFLYKRGGMYETATGNGWLIRTKVEEAEAAMLTLHLIGNGYYSRRIINTIVQAYNYAPNDVEFTATAGTHFGDDLGDVKVFLYGGHVCFWVSAKTDYQTCSIFVYNTYGALNGTCENCVDSISLSPMPAVGVSKLTVVTPSVALTDNDSIAADRLKNYRLFWGNPFNGTNDVSGSLSGVRDITMDGDIDGANVIRATSINLSTGSKSVSISAGRIVATNNIRSKESVTSDGNITAKGDISSQGNISAQGSVTALTTSDMRLKWDFDYTRSYTDRLLAMGRVCDFRYTEKARKRNKGGVDGEAHTGLLYQKVKEVLPSMAYETEDGYGALNYLSPDYINTIAGATQETARLVKALMEDIERLKKELSELKGKGGK